MIKSMMQMAGLKAVIATSIVCFSMGGVLAQVMTSNNFQMQSDSVNIGGGLSSSTNFRQESTVGEIATGPATSTSYQLRAGYQQMQSAFLALSAVPDVAMSISLPGVTGGTAYGTTTAVVTTDNLAGYTLTIAAENTPAMQKGADTIADYVPAGASPDFSFITGVSDAHFGFSPEGADVVQRFLDNGAICNTGSIDSTGSCWDGLSTTDVEIAAGTMANHPTGATTTIVFQLGIGSGVVQPAGLYTATTTVTALPL